MTTVADDTYERLRAEILSGTWAPGERLLEAQLAESMKVSRTPVRQALHRLGAGGLVELLPNRGAVVSRWDDRDVDEIFELRALLEGYSARLAAQRVTPERLRELVDLCDSMDALRGAEGELDYDELTRLNLRLHSGIHESADNTRLTALISGVIQVPLVHHTFHAYTREEVERSLAHHRELTDAMAARDGAWAEAVMRAHVRAARASFRRSRAESDGDTPAPAPEWPR